MFNWTMPTFADEKEEILNSKSKFSDEMLVSILQKKEIYLNEQGRNLLFTHPLRELAMDALLRLRMHDILTEANITTVLSHIYPEKISHILVTFKKYGIESKEMLDMMITSAINSRRYLIDSQRFALQHLIDENILNTKNLSLVLTYKSPLMMVARLKSLNKAQLLIPSFIDALEILSKNNLLTEENEETIFSKSEHFLVLFEDLSKHHLLDAQNIQTVLAYKDNPNVIQELNDAGLLEGENKIALSNRPEFDYLIKPLSLRRILNKKT